jgi:hypothetical protein
MNKYQMHMLNSGYSTAQPSSRDGKPSLPVDDLAYVFKNISNLPSQRGAPIGNSANHSAQRSLLSLPKS